MLILLKAVACAASSQAAALEVATGDALDEPEQAQASMTVSSGLSVAWCSGPPEP